jgi:hypothetical protein
MFRWEHFSDEMELHHGVTETRRRNFFSVALRCKSNKVLQLGVPVGTYRRSTPGTVLKCSNWNIDLKTAHENVPTGTGNPHYVSQNSSMSH